MAKMTEFELFDDATNAVVARHLQRNFPGFLIQGDTLKTLFDEVEELRENVATGNLESVKEISDVLHVKLATMLIHYEKVIRKHNQELPYVGSVSPT